ncbi:unnamed protein product [Rhizophagus irregularis]|nr:unnamed protein product [Rhizophagus irregularis]
MEKKIQKTTKIPKNRRRKYCTSYDDIEYPSIEPIEPPVPMTSIRAILNHSNQLPSVSNWQTTTITETQNLKFYVVMLECVGAEKLNLIVSTSKFGSYVLQLTHQKNFLFTLVYSLK